MNFNVLGAGSVGLRHIKNLLSLGHTISMVHDPNPKKSEEIKRIAPGAQLTLSEDEVFSDSCDALLLCSPTVDHARQLEIALMRDRDVFVEKPISHTLDLASRLISLSDSKQSVVLVGCNLRFFPSLLRVKQMVENGDVGEPLSARIYGGFYLPYWRPKTDYRKGYGAQSRLGGGVILDFVHELDMMRWLFGEPIEVMAMMGKVSQLEIDTEDLAVAIIKFDSGVLVELHLDYLQPTYRRGLEIYGECRAVIWDYIDQNVRLYTAENNAYQVFQEAINTERNDMYVREMEHFIRCLQREVQPEVGVQGGFAAVRLAEMIKTSAREKRAVSLL